MATRTITGTLKRADGTPWPNARVQFSMWDSTYTETATFPQDRKAVTTADGTFSIDLEAGLPTAWQCVLPDGEAFNFVLEPGAPVTIEYLRAIDGFPVPITPAAQIAIDDAIAPVVAELDAKADQTALDTLQAEVDTLPTSANIDALQDEIDTKADAATVTSALALKANTADVNAALATKATPADITAAVDPVADDVAALETTVSGKADTATVNAALALKADQTDVQTLSDELDTVVVDLGTKADQSALDTVSNQVLQNTAQIAQKAYTVTVNAALALKADQSALDDTNDAVALNASLIADKADAAATQTALNTKATIASVDALSDVVDTKADASALATTNATVATKATRRYADVLDFYQTSDAGDYSLAVTRAIADLAGPGEVILPNRAEAYRTLIDIPSDITIRGFGSASEIVVDSDLALTYRLFRSWGTVGSTTALTTNATALSHTVTLPAGQGANWDVGDVLEIKSSLSVYGGYATAKDVRKVMAKAGDVLTLDAMLLYNFTVADGATVAKVTSVRNVGLADFRVSNPDPVTNKAYLFETRYSENASVKNVSMKDAGGALGFVDSLSPVVDGFHVDYQPNGWLTNLDAPALGYGVFFAGNVSQGIVTNSTFKWTRHAFTTLASTGGGGPRDCIVSNCISYQSPGLVSGTSHFDTHDAGNNIQFIGCQAIGGGEAGFQNRATDTQIIDCTAIGVGSRGVSGVNTGPRLQVKGGEFIDCGRGVATTTVHLSGAGSRMIGAHLVRSSAAGISIAGNDVLVERCHIEDSANYGIQYSSGANPRVVANIIPFSTGRQQVGILAMPATGVIKDNVLLGYAVDNNAILNTVAGCIVEGNIYPLRGYRASSATSITIQPSDILFSGHATGGAITVALPAASTCTGRQLTIKKTDATANGVVIDPSGAELIDGAATKTLGSQNAAIQIISIGTAWAILAQMGTIT